MSVLRRTHGEILALQEEMKEDEKFKGMCEKYELPWDIVGGYGPLEDLLDHREPQFYCGQPKDTVIL